MGFNDGLSAAQPGMVDGFIVSRYDPFSTRKQLGGATIFTSGPNATTLPHLAGEWKGPGKDMILAQTQAAYDGAAMVYGRNKARSFLESPDLDGHAFVSTFTTDSTTLNAYAHCLCPRAKSNTINFQPLALHFKLQGLQEGPKTAEE